jgi:uncharacterized membrane protein
MRSQTNDFPASNVIYWRSSRALLVQFALLAAVALLPSACHLMRAPVQLLLPMHWPVLLAGLMYGPEAGLAVGICAPLVSFALSGMPPAGTLPFMLPEIAAYGFVAGLCRSNLKLGGWLSVLAAVLAGRAVYALLTAACCGVPGIKAVLIAGLPVAGLQVILLPPLAAKAVKLAGK